MTREEIKQIRQRMEMTQEAFSRFLGVSLRSVAGWESGRSQPRGLYLEKLKDVLNRKEEK